MRKKITIFLMMLIASFMLITSTNKVYAEENTYGYGIASNFSEPGTWVHYQGNNVISYNLWSQGIILNLNDTIFSEATSVKWEVYFGNETIPSRTSSSRTFNMLSLSPPSQDSIKIKVVLTYEEDPTGNTYGYGIASNFSEPGTWLHYQGNNAITYNQWSQGIIFDIDSSPFADVTSVKWEVYFGNEEYPSRTSNSRTFNMLSLSPPSQDAIKVKVILSYKHISFGDDYVLEVPEDTENITVNNVETNLAEFLGLDKDIFTVTFDKQAASTTAFNTTSTPKGIRMYWNSSGGNKMTVTVKDGYLIDAYSLELLSNETNGSNDLAYKINNDDLVFIPDAKKASPHIQESKFFGKNSITIENVSTANVQLVINKMVLTIIEVEESFESLFYEKITIGNNISSVGFEMYILGESGVFEDFEIILPNEYTILLNDMFINHELSNLSKLYFSERFVSNENINIVVTSYITNLIFVEEELESFVIVMKSSSFDNDIKVKLTIVTHENIPTFRVNDHFNDVLSTPNNIEILSFQERFNQNKDLFYIKEQITFSKVYNYGRIRNDGDYDWDLITKDDKAYITNDSADPFDTNFPTNKRNHPFLAQSPYMNFEIVKNLVGSGETIKIDVENVAAVYYSYDVFYIYYWENNELQLTTYDTVESNLSAYFYGGIKEAISGEEIMIANVDNLIPLTDFLEFLVAWDDLDGDISDQIFIEDDGDYQNNVVGIYTVIFGVTDSENNTSYFEADIHVVDIVAPVITGTANDVQISYTGTFNVNSWINSLTVTDNYYDDLTVTLKTDTYTANKGIPGSYYIEAKSIDGSGNVGILRRNIIVVDDQGPVFQGLETVTTSVAENLTAEDIKVGLAAIDAIDGNVTNSITIDSDQLTSNNTQPGVYEVVFKAVDSQGNAGFHTVTVTIVSAPPKFYIIDGASIRLLPGANLTIEQILALLGVTDPTNLTTNYNAEEPGTYQLSFTVGNEDYNLNIIVLGANQPGIPPVLVGDNNFKIDWKIVGWVVLGLVAVVGVAYILKKKK